MLREQNRKSLEWTVEDGWVPVCNFLDEPVPSEEFPSGDKPDAFAVTVMNITAAKSNLQSVVSTLVLLVAVAALMVLFVPHKT